MRGRPRIARADDLTVTAAARLRRQAGYSVGVEGPDAIGTEDDAALRRWLDGGGDPDEAAAAALRRGLSCAVPHLEVIAEANDLTDPFAPEVVEAHWLGSDLLRHVKPRLLVKRLLREHDGAPEITARITATADHAVAHHAYHALVVHPWVAAADASPDAMAAADACRVQVGTVESIDGDLLTVRRRAWVAQDGQIRDTPPAVQTCRRASRSSATWLSPGDSVAVHWGQVVDRLIPAQAQALRRITTQLVQAVNATLLSPDR